MPCGVRRRPGRVAFDCAFWLCPFLAVPGDGAFVFLAGDVTLLVCEFCRRDLERGRPAGTSGTARALTGDAYLVFKLDRSEGYA